MTLRELLSVPYLVEAELVEDGNGGWARRARHPELPECEAQCPRIERTLDLLDRQRVEVIVGLLRNGMLPHVPRPPLLGADPEGLLLRAGLHAEFAPLLDRRAAEITDK